MASALRARPGPGAAEPAGPAPPEPAPPEPAPPEPSDEALLARFADSDPEASAEFVRRFERRVFGLAFTILGDRRAAEEVAQEALLRAWRRASVFDARRGSVAAWLLTITRNLAIDMRRARRAVVVDPSDLQRLLRPSSEPDPVAVALLGDDVERLREAVAALPAEQRRAVVLAGVWGLSGREIAEREHIPLGTAKTRIRTALTRLRGALNDESLGESKPTGSIARHG
jgi:RNA polymerase sigma factor (sigma-70 family)